MEARRLLDQDFMALIDLVCRLFQLQIFFGGFMQGVLTMQRVGARLSSERL